MKTHTICLLALLLAMLLPAPPARAGNQLVPNLPSTMGPWTAAFARAEADVDAAFQSGASGLDFLSAATLQLNNNGISASALLDLHPTLYPVVSAYTEIPFTILWRLTNPKDSTTETATCWYVDPAAAPFCVEGDMVSMFGATGYDLGSSWRLLVDLMVALETTGFAAVPTGFSMHGAANAEEGRDCVVRSCLRIREDQVSIGNLFGSNSAASRAVWAGFGLGLGAGASGGTVLLGTSGAIAASGVVALTGKLTGAGLLVVVGGVVGTAAVVGAVVGGAIARDQYIASGKVFGYEIGGGNHRCGDCGQAGSNYFGWTVDHSGLNCGSPGCDDPHEEQGHGPACERPGDHRPDDGGAAGGGAGGNSWNGPIDSGDGCSLWLSGSGEMCAVCNEPEDAQTVEDPCIADGDDGECEWSCQICLDNASASFGKVDACVSYTSESVPED